MSEDFQNINVGLLGHVDSGKTAIARVLSTLGSTASFDKSPHEKLRGKTIDLGFSSVMLPEKSLRIAFVDCPGHAKLIKVVIGGAHIIDMMFLVIDITKGIQTQTAECIILGEIASPHMVVVLNKIDAVPKDKLEKRMTKVTRRIRGALKDSKFANPTIIPFSAKEPTDAMKQQLLDAIASYALSHSKDTLASKTKALSQYMKQQQGDTKSTYKPFLMAIDHCFLIKGQGTVMTGTLLEGRVDVGDMIEIAGYQLSRRVKSIQKFKQPAPFALAGERAGLLISDFKKTSEFERGYLCSPNLVSTYRSFIASVSPIRHYSLPIRSRSKFHITIGHETIMGTPLFFRCKRIDWSSVTSPEQQSFVFPSNFDQFEWLDELACPLVDDYCYFAQITLESPLSSYPSAKLIASKLDVDVHAKMCRLAFSGELLASMSFPISSTSTTLLRSSSPDSLALYKYKSRSCSIDTNPRILSKTMTPSNLIGDGLVDRALLSRFKKNKSSMSHPLLPFVGNRLHIELAPPSSSSPGVSVTGVIESLFGKNGKFNIRLDDPLPSPFVDDTGAIALKGGEPCTLYYRTNVFDPSRSWQQSTNS